MQIIYSVIRVVVKSEGQLYLKSDGRKPINMGRKKRVRWCNLSVSLALVGKPLAGQTKSSLGVLRNSKPSSPSPSSSNVVNWSFPPKTKVGPPLPDITVGHNGSSTPVASDPLLAPEDRSGGCISSSLPQSPSNDEAEPPGKSAIHQAVDVGDFCCPSFSGGVRPSRLVAAGGAEQPSVTCSFL